MATRDEYDVFKAVYDDEIARFTRLSSRANLYFTIISFFLGAIIFKFDDLTKFLFLFHVPMVSYLIIALALTIGLFFTLLAITIRGYEGITDLAKADPDAKDFWRLRMADLATATASYGLQNNRVAALLRGASVSILVAAGVQVLVICIAITLKIYTQAAAVKKPAGSTATMSRLQKRPPQMSRHHVEGHSPSKSSPKGPGVTASPHDGLVVQ